MRRISKEQCVLGWFSVNFFDSGTKGRLKKGVGELLITCKLFRLRAVDRKYRQTDVANTQTLFCIIQSVPSEKAESFKKFGNKRRVVL